MKIRTLLYHILIITTVLICSCFNSYSQTENILTYPFNSGSYKTISPYISYDETKFVFVKETDDERELAECYKKEDGSWSDPEGIETVNAFDSVDFYIESPSYNHNASEIYFSLKYSDKEADADIYFIKKENGVWSIPEKLSDQINSNLNETDPFVSADGKFLFFARSYENNDIKKYDCYQILVSERKNNIWQIPLILPEPVNEGCDRCPRLAPDGKTLLFASVRGDGKSNFDLYYAKKITKNAWMSPVPVDTVNNTNFEYFPSIPHKGTRVYYLKTSGEGKKDYPNFVIAVLDYQFQPEKSVHLYGIVTDLKSKQPISAKIDLIDPNTSEIISTSKNDAETGRYSVFLEKGRKYRIVIYNDRYSNYFFTYNTYILSDFKDVEKNIELYPEVDLIVNVYDSEIFEPLEAKLSVYDLDTEDLLSINPLRVETGRFTLTLPIGRNYKVEAENSHFENNSFELDLRGVVQFSEFERDLELLVKKIDYVFNLTDEETGEGVEAYIEIINLTTNERIVKKVKTDKDGKLNIKLRDGTRYEINISPQGYAFYNTTVDLVGEDPSYSTDAKLTPLRKKTKLELNNIYFETNSADLNKSSFEELDRLVKLLKNNPQIKIEISAHTDDIGSEFYNLKLSERRAESVKEYLFEKTVSKSQIISKGYGESKPAYLPFNTDENRAKNRRVELEVIDVNEE